MFSSCHRQAASLRPATTEVQKGRRIWVTAEARDRAVDGPEGCQEFADRPSIRVGGEICEEQVYSDYAEPEENDHHGKKLLERAYSRSAAGGQDGQVTEKMPCRRADPVTTT